MASARHVIVAGAGIAGLTAALALARVGFRITVIEQAERLEETGAGLQLSPNATRVLIALGLGERLGACAIAPQAVRVMAGGSGREVVRIPLAESGLRYGAPFWVLHRGDLQAALADAAQARPEIAIKLGTRVEEFAADAEGVRLRGRGDTEEARGIALIGADGIWSSVAKALPRRRGPCFAHRTAWRALVPAEAVSAEFRAPLVHLWLGQDAHLVHYPVKAGRLINIVGIVPDEWRDTGWSAPGERGEILRHFARRSWSDRARELIGIAERWQKWALYHGARPFAGEGPVTLIGDAAHAMLPFLAQGAGMAIEDAAVLAACLGRSPEHAAAALRAYEAARRTRTARAQRASRAQGRIYGLSGPEALLRNLAMRALGGERLRGRYDWLYSWQPPNPFSNTSTPS